MKRFLVFAVIFALAHASTAVAGETLLASAKRIVRESARATEVSTSNAGTAALRTRASVPSFGAALGQAAPALETSGMSKGKKIMIAVAAAVGFAATAYAIDHKVQDVTPSSLGTRQD